MKKMSELIQEDGTPKEECGIGSAMLPDREENYRKLQGYDESESVNDFSEWLSARNKIQDVVNASEVELRKITSDNNGGLTPDSIKSSDEYKKAKSAYDKAFSALRDFNGKSSKEFMRRASKVHSGKPDIDEVQELGIGVLEKEPDLFDMWLDDGHEKYENTVDVDEFGIPKG